MKRLNVIVCPNCGKEYLPAEIFVPAAFFGKPDLIKRDVNGKIEDVSGEPGDMRELYCCDSCNTSFNVATKISFTTEVDEKTNFNEDYVSDMKARFTLKEF